MPELLIILIVFVVVMVSGMYGFSVLASKLVTHAIQIRLKAVEQITAGRVPDDWLRPFQRRVATLRQTAAEEARFSRLSKHIQRRCLRNLDEMIRFTTRINYTDSAATQKELIGILNTYQEAWAARDWREWITDVENLDTPTETGEGI
ncbi:MAG TPA: hypothetical protein PLJ78_12525 [Anaerolineae bacterium]|nr:hypothetical protein [Anaerolineae bacterium]HQK14755.1 hypothetical protein [Anaerolineae bacterium]